MRQLRRAAFAALLMATGAAIVLASCGSPVGTDGQRGTPPVTSTPGTFKSPAPQATSADTREATSTPTAAAPDASDAGTMTTCHSGACWVDVSVATAWVKPWFPRAIDQPALGNPAYPGKWLSELTVAQKAWLVGKLETQALYGAKVTVIGHWGSWSHVAVGDQPTNRDTRGYPGWIPTVQLTATAPAAAAEYAVVRAPTAWVWSAWSTAGVAGREIMLSSYNTSFPVVRASARYVEIRLLGGRTAALRSADVVVHRAGTSAGATRAQVVAEAKIFLSLPYLWGGTSGFGFDCSDFTYSIYKAYAITISRDADQQAVHGTPVIRTELQPGDLVFFRGSPGGPITHVGMYVGNGLMIDAPNTGSAVRIEAVWWSSYAGARRYLA